MTKMKIIKTISKNPKLLLKYYKFFLLVAICLLILLIFRKLHDANVSFHKKKISNIEVLNENQTATSSITNKPAVSDNMVVHLNETVAHDKLIVSKNMIVNENQLQTNKFQADLYGRKPRNIVIDPKCLLLYDTKGKNMCDAPIMIATNDKSLLTASNPSYHYVSFEGNLDSKYLLFHINGETKAMPRNYKAGRFLECHPTITDEEMVAVAETHKYRRRIPTQFADRVAQFLEVLSWFSITGFLFNGSLLGWRRECSIIPHTWDTDIGMFAEQHSQELINALKAKTIPNFKLTNMYGWVEDSLEVQVWVDGTRIDLFYIYQNPANNTSYSASMRGAAKQQIKSIYPRFTEICAGVLHGILVHLPCDVDKILQADYGVGWRQDEDTDHYFWDKNPKNLEDWRFLNDTEFEAAYQTFY